MDIDEIMHKHLTRAFDSGRVIPEETFNKFLAFLRSAPSSLNVQPWHFYVLSSPESKERLASSLGDMFEAGNRAKVTDASHAIIVTTRADLPESHVRNVFAQEDADGRFPEGEYRDGWQASVRGFLSTHTPSTRNSRSAKTGIPLPCSLLSVTLTSRRSAINRSLGSAWTGYLLTSEYLATETTSRGELTTWHRWWMVCGTTT